MDGKWQLQMDEGISYFSDFEEMIEVIDDELYDHFNHNTQSYYNRVPFSVGVLESSLYDESTITDEQIVIFQRIEMLLGVICQLQSINYIKHDYSLHYEDDYTYDLNINKKDNDILLSLKVDCGSYIDLLETNMFNMDKNKEYYFKSRQTVVIKSPEDPLPLGTKIGLDIKFNPFNF